MRLCAHVRLYQVSPNTFMGTGFMEHISRLKICYRDIAYTIKRKHNSSVHPFRTLAKFGKGTLSQCFSCLLLSLSKASAKVRILFELTK